MPEQVYILTSEQWMALTSCAAILRNTGYAISEEFPNAGQSAVNAAERALDAVQDVYPTARA